MEQLSAEGTAMADIASVQPHSGDGFWEVPATPEMQTAPSKHGRKPPGCCASLSLLLEKHPGEHPGTPLLLQSSHIDFSLSYSEMNGTPSREMALLLNSPSAWHGGHEVGKAAKGLSQKVSLGPCVPAPSPHICMWAQEPV